MRSHTREVAVGAFNIRTDGEFVWIDAGDRTVAWYTPHAGEVTAGTVHVRDPWMLWVPWVDMVRRLLGVAVPDGMRPLWTREGKTLPVEELLGLHLNEERCRFAITLDRVRSLLTQVDADGTPAMVVRDLTETLLGAESRVVRDLFCLEKGACGVVGLYSVAHGEPVAWMREVADFVTALCQSDSDFGIAWWCPRTEWTCGVCRETDTGAHPFLTACASGMREAHGEDFVVSATPENVLEVLRGYIHENKANEGEVDVPTGTRLLRQIAKSIREAAP